MLVLSLTRTLSRGDAAWAEFADTGDEEALASAIVAAQGRLEAETEVDEIVSMKRTSVRQERTNRELERSL